MIIIRPTGGLGNQMFQYALGLSKSVENKTTLKINPRAYTENNLRKYILDNFNLSSGKASIVEIALTKKIFPNNYFDERIWDHNSNWQGEKNFKNIKDRIKKEFSLKIPLEEKYQENEIVSQIKNTESVSIHIRRTDYLKKQDTYVVLDTNYYNNAIDFIEKNHPNSNYFIFADDIDWAKENISAKNVTFVSGKDFADYEELVLQSMCKHNIIANSTFSWWAAWLNGNPNKIVITPEKWFNKKGLSSEDLYVEGWVKI